MDNRPKPSPFNSFIDSCLKNSQFQSSDEYQKARILSGSIFLGVLICIGLGMLFYSQTQQLSILQAILLIQAFIYAVLFLFLKYIGRVTFCCHSMIIVTAVAAVCFIYYTGGPFLTPAKFILLLVPLLAFILLDTEFGIWWSFGVFALQALSVAAIDVSHPFPNILATENLAIVEMVLWSISFCLVITSILVFEKYKNQLQCERDIEHEQQKFFSSHDPLTKLANRGLFTVHLERALARSRRNKQRVALILINLDRFKQVNEQLGDQAGDILLRVVGDRLSTVVRETDAVARISGDEFAIILENFNSAQDARRIASIIQQKITPAIEELGHGVSITASIGMSLAPDHGLDPNMLRHFADAAMRQAKQKRNCICQYESGLAN